MSEVVVVTWLSWALPVVIGGVCPDCHRQPGEQHSAACPALAMREEAGPDGR